jgi:hypothetical protein
MWKLAFIFAAFAISLSPVDARQPPARPDVDKPSDLRRDVERISREIYPERSESRASRGSFAAGPASKKR